VRQRQGTRSSSEQKVIKQFVSTLRTAFPDLQLAVENMVAEGDYVAFNYTINGTHQGEFMGIEPAGKRVSVRAMEMVQIAGGQMVDRWGNTDELGLLNQLGALPPIGQE
jgi:predicted ester cyclase